MAEVKTKFTMILRDKYILSHLFTVINWLLVRTLCIIEARNTQQYPTSPDIPSRMSDDSHYFGVAEIGNVISTEDGNLRATILNFRKFKYPVSIRRADGSYYEENPFWQQGVRTTNKSVYDRIVVASCQPSVVTTNKSSGLFRIITLTNLVVGLESNAFCHGKYQVVTGPDGYYLKNIADGVFYELAKVANFSYKIGSLKVLAKSSNTTSKTLSFLIRHQTTITTDIGLLDQIQNGLHFSGRIDGKNIEIDLFT